MSCDIFRALRKLCNDKTVLLIMPNMWLNSEFRMAQNLVNMFIISECEWGKTVNQNNLWINGL